MNFSDIGYRGDFLQIPPQTRLNESAGLFLLGTSYGDPNLMNVLFDEWEREYLSANQDLDVTSPFPKLTVLDGVANRIYTTILFINEFIYNQYNRDEYTEGFELAVIQKFNSRLYWAQIGFPLMFLNTKENVIPIDSNFGFRSKTPNLAPNIPSALVGIERSINFKVETINIKGSEELFFVKSTTLPGEFYQQTHLSNEDLIKVLHKTAPNQGAWLGRLSFK